MTEGDRLPIGLAAYGFGYLGGFVGAGTPRACPNPLDATRLLELAVQFRLGGIEFPPAWGLPSLDRAALQEFGTEAARRGLFVVLDAGVVDEAELRELLPMAAAIGARTVRATISTILCGDRRAVRETWRDYLDEIARRLRAVRPLAEDLGVAIGLENHQDVTSDELVALCDAVDSPQVGVTLDTINPLAVAEEPLAFARRVAPYLKHVHLKDYHLHRTPEGYRLVRCAVGDGVLDAPAVLALCAREAPGAAVAIEMGALQARHVRLLEDDFWSGYAPRSIADVLPVLRLRERTARPPEEEWRTPWERDEPGERLAAYEMEQCERSVAYLRGLALKDHGREPSLKALTRE